METITKDKVTRVLTSFYLNRKHSKAREVIREVAEQLDIVIAYEN